jgi:hypothetical protein
MNANRLFRRVWNYQNLSSYLQVADPIQQDVESGVNIIHIDPSEVPFRPF